MRLSLSDGWCNLILTRQTFPEKRDKYIFSRFRYAEGIDFRIILRETFLEPGPLFSKRTDALPQDPAKSRNRETWVLDFFNRSEIRQAHRQQRCRDVCAILERFDNYNNKSRGFETSRDFALRRPSS